MAKIRFLNKTRYTKQFQKKVAAMHIFSKERITIPATLIMISMFMGTVALRNDPNSLNGWLMMLIGFILLPLIFLLIPYLITMNAYKNMANDSKDNEFVIEAEFTNSVLRLKNSLGQTSNILYENISSIETSKNIMIIKQKNSNQSVYLSVDSFIEGSYQELDSFLKEKLKQNNQN